MESVPRLVIAAAAIIALLIAGWRFQAEDSPRVQAADAGQRTTETNAEARFPASPQYANPMAVVGPAVAGGELCGYGRVNMDALPAEVEAAADVAILRAAKDAQASTDDGRKALGLATQAFIAAQAAERGVLAEDYFTCLVSALCDEKAARSFKGAAEPLVEATAALALTTRDPKAYAIALRLCGSLIPDSPPDGCSALTVEKWAQLDDDNALPWLLTARAARKRNDAAAVDYALQRASQARFFDRRTARYGELLLDTELGSAPERATTVFKLLSAEQRLDPLDYLFYFNFVSPYCAAPNDRQRAELCGNLRLVLLDHTVDPLGQDIGNWIPAPGGTAELMARQSAAFSRVSFEGRPWSFDLSCANSERTEAWLRGVAKNGELGYRRAWVAAREEALMHAKDAAK